MATEHIHRDFNDEEIQNRALKMEYIIEHLMYPHCVLTPNVD